MATPDQARAFARTQREGKIEGASTSMAAQVAFTPEGHALIATPDAAEHGTIRLLLGEAPHGRLSLEGSMATLQPGDEARLLAIHAEPGANRRRLEPEKIEWTAPDRSPTSIEPHDWTLPYPEWKDGEAGINDHMNDDHVDAMERMCRVFLGLESTSPRLVAVDPEGLVMDTGNHLVHVAFDTPAYSHDEVHHATVRLARLARQRETEGG